MFKKNKGRIISTSVYLISVSVWSLITYGYFKHDFNLWLNVTYTILIGLVVWWQASFYDRSKALVEQLHETEEQYLQLLNTYTFITEQLASTVFFCDKEGKLVLLNPAWEQLTGYSFEESLGKNFLDFIHPNDREKSITTFTRLIEKKQETVKEEIRIITKSGEPIWVEKNSKIQYDDCGKPKSFTGAMMEITNRKLNEERLIEMNDYLTIQSEKLKVVAQLSASIAHEVRNPLTSISGFLQLIKENKDLKDEYIDIIFAELERIGLVLNEFLVLSKPNSRNFQPFNFAKALEYVVALISSEANMRNTDIQVSGFDQSEWVYGDENQIKQVLINLIKNAIEAMPEGGVVEITKSSTPSHIVVHVTDSGPGIPDEVLKYIGQPFFTTKETGTGLGLSICKKILENHKGKMEIESTNNGTTIKVILPRYLQKEEVTNEEEKLAETEFDALPKAENT